jgi:AbrB family looped-hinge helix DNA binding protein
MNAESQIDEKGRVCIPSEIRKKLNLNPGEKIFFQIDKDDQIVLRKLTTPRELKQKARELKEQLKQVGDTPVEYQKLF